MKPRLLIAALLAATLACRPVLTIGWGEIAILILLIAILLGPVIFRFARRMNEFQAWKTSREKKNEKQK